MANKKQALMRADKNLLQNFKLELQLAL